MGWSGSSWLGREWAGKCGSFGSCSQRRIQMSANMCSDGMAESPMFCEWVFSVDLTATRNSYISCIHSLGEAPRSVVPTISTPCVLDPGTVVGMRSERVDLNMPPFALPLSNHETLGRPQTAKHPHFFMRLLWRWGGLLRKQQEYWGAEEWVCPQWGVYPVHTHAQSVHCLSLKVIRSSFRRHLSFHGALWAHNMTLFSGHYSAEFPSSVSPHHPELIMSGGNRHKPGGRTAWDFDTVLSVPSHLPWLKTTHDKILFFIGMSHIVSVGQENKMAERPSAENK